MFNDFETNLKLLYSFLLYLTLLFCLTSQLQKNNLQLLIKYWHYRLQFESAKNL